MRSIEIPRPGPPDVLRLRHDPDPRPRAGQVLIEVAASGVNFADIMARLGLYPDAPKMPCVVGYEVAGRVAEVGEGVTRYAVGDRVIAMTRFKGYASYVVAPENQVMPIPTGWSELEGAALPVNYVTAYQLIVVMGGLKPGERILIHGIAGGVGHAATQIARHIGAEIYGTASAGKHEGLRAAGVAHPIDYHSVDYEDEIRRLTDGQGVHLILDPFGGEHWRKNFRILAPTGRLGMFGASAFATGKDRNMLAAVTGLLRAPRYSPLQLMDLNRGVFGVNVGHLWNQIDMVSSWLFQLLAWAEEGIIRPVVGATFPLEDAALAHEYIQDRKNVGKVVLTVE